MLSGALSGLKQQGSEGGMEWRREGGKRLGFDGGERHPVAGFIARAKGRGGVAWRGTARVTARERGRDSDVAVRRMMPGWGRWAG